MSQAFTLAPPPHSAPRRRASRPQMEATVQFTRSGSSSKTTIQSSVEATPVPVSVPVSVVTSTPDATLEVVAERSRSASRSFKRFKSPFSRSAPSSPERSATAAAAPEFPAQLSDKVAALKASEESTSKASKKSKAKSAEKKKADDKVHYHANSSNQRPMNYATNVQLEMLMGGGSQDYWLSKSRKTGNSGEEGEDEEEVGGFKDEDGNIWWDVEEKSQWTSLLPKDGQGLPATNDMWVDFNTDYRRSSTSSADSTISSFSAELMEEMDGPVLYGDVEAEQAHNTLYGMQRATGTVLFPIAMGDESAADASAARAIMSQAKQTLSGKSAVVISNEFEDSFLSYEASNVSSTVRVVNVVPTKEISVVAVPVAKTKKSGLLKGLWGSKSSSSRQ